MCHLAVHAMQQGCTQVASKWVACATATLLVSAGTEATYARQVRVQQGRQCQRNWYG